MVRIITDSTCDIPPERVAKLNIEVLPLVVNFGNESYRDGVDISVPEFYERLAKSDVLPFTSQVNPSEFEAAFRRCVEASDEVVYLGISSELSGTYQSAYLAKVLLPDASIHIIDTHTVTFALGLLVEIAVSLRDKGLSAEKIAENIRELSTRTRLVAAVDTLKYLKMGGRLSAASAVVGSLLNISPIVSVVNGKVQAIGKARGRKAAFRFMLRELQNDRRDEDYPVSFGHSHAPERLMECMEFFAPHVDTACAVIGNIGCIVGTHAGPGAVGIAYIIKQA